MKISTNFFSGALVHFPFARIGTEILSFLPTHSL